LTFSNEQAAYEWYNSYAKVHGFGIRKRHKDHNESGNIKMHVLCNKEGLRDKKHLIKDDRKKEQKLLTHTNCNVKLRVKLDKKCPGG